MKQKVVVFSQIDAEVLQCLEQRYHVVVINLKAGDVNMQIREQVADADAMIGAGRLLNQNNLETAKQLKIISSVSVGYDNYDLNYLNQAKIWLSHTPHVLTETTADLAFTLLMSAARQVSYLDQWTKTGQWSRTVGQAQFGQEIFWSNIGYYWLRKYWCGNCATGFSWFQYEYFVSRAPRKIRIGTTLTCTFLRIR